MKGGNLVTYIIRLSNVSDAREANLAKKTLNALEGIENAEVCHCEEGICFDAADTPDETALFAAMLAAGLEPVSIAER